MHGTIGHGRLQVMDSTGHTEVRWNPAEPVEVSTARETFERMTRDGYRAFRIEGADQQGTRISEFDPAAAKIMLIPHLRGG